MGNSEIYMRKLFAILILCVLVSCSNKSDEIKKITDSEIESKKSSTLLIETEDSSATLKKGQKNTSKEELKVIPQITKFEYFNIAYLDYYRGNLSRVFITIDTNNIYNKTIIQSVICDIKTEFDINESSNVSFFSETKYADYKTNLFVFENHTLPKEEYKNWTNYYYLAEFSFSSMEYKTYPSCRIDYKRQKTINIICL